MKIIFVGGVCTDSLSDYIIDRSNGPMQNAANVLQRNYLYGLVNVDSMNDVVLVNLPFIGSYPSYFSDKRFCPVIKIEKMYGLCKVFNCAFNNIKGVKNISRFFVSLSVMLKLLKKDSSSNIVCYSMHLPFLIACYLAKLINRSCGFYVIIPDLPEYMSERVGLSKFLYRILNKLSYFIVNRSNGAVFITSQMADRFSPELPYVVIEGITTITDNLLKTGDSWWHEGLTKGEYFLYSGTLDKRYGIRDLIDSYICSGVEDKKLVICGDGNDRTYVEEMSLRYHNINYLGQLEHNKTKILQLNAALLINPRSNEGEFTKYSFPSKVIEYMNSGVPTLMYKLDGIPHSYYQYFFHIESKCDFSRKLKTISMMERTELLSLGIKAKEFISRTSGPVRQVNKLMSLISKK